VDVSPSAKECYLSIFVSQGKVSLQRYFNLQRTRKVAEINTAIKYPPPARRLAPRGGCFAPREDANGFSRKVTRDLCQAEIPADQRAPALSCSCRAGSNFKGAASHRRSERFCGAGQRRPGSLLYVVLLWGLRAFESKKSSWVVVDFRLWPICSSSPAPAYLFICLFTSLLS